ncbi:MAG: PKD domain-containing protein [Bacteroidetes bacterium]|nr:PKD domain-containing protein [Bacteroidota bacterium]
MKKITFVVVVLFCALFSFSQTSGGPDTYGYSWKNDNHSSNPPAFTWVDITTIGTLVTGLADDNIVGPISISGGFHFYWYDVTQVWIGSNGYISFNADNIASPFPASIPLTSGANNWIAPLLSDLNFTGTSNPATCYYYSNSDSFIISFIQLPFWQSPASTGIPYTGSNTFQIILSQLDSSITINYLSTDLGAKTSIDDAVGIENVTGSIGLQNYIDVLPPDSLTIKYYYPQSVTYSAVDGGIMWNENDKNGGIFMSKNGAPLSLKANIKNLGNQSFSGFSIFDSIRNSSSALISTSNSNVGTLNPGNSTTVNFSNTFTATAAGTYTFNTRLSGITGDIVAANDYLQHEIVVVDTTQALMALDYSDGSYDAGLAWNGGNGGVAIYIEPPFYPCRIKSSKFYISSNASTPMGFYAKIYDDNGANGGHGTLLDSVFIAGTSVTTSTYNTVTTADTNLVIYSGGVYLLWYMQGAGINIGKDYTPPFSRRTFEVLSNGWANYRDILTEDFLMGINIETLVPTADFSVNTSSDPNMGFTDKSGKYPTSWYWTFGDNSTASIQNPSHTYSVNGTYNVCLAVTNAYGSDTFCKNVYVYNVPPVANFTMDTTADPQVSFYDQSTSNPVNWLWDFDDDGATSAVSNPTYTFIANGKHDVCMKVSNGGGSDSICKTIYITNAPPSSNFSIDSTSDPIIQFTSLALNNPTSWNWDFGDNATSTSVSPSHTYAANGSYTACLAVSNAVGADTFCKTVVVSHIAPIADFSFDTVLDPKVRFYDQSQNGPYSWYWDFGANNATATTANASYTYTENGTYQVCHKAKNNGGIDSVCKSINIHKIPPVSNFTYNDSLDPHIAFTDISTKKPTAWLWNFGDGNTSTLQNPTHVFTDNGDYNVCLTVYNSGGNNKYCKKVTVTKIVPIADFSYYTPLDPKILFTDLSTKKPTSWYWDFDDNGANSTLQDPSHTFTISGNHNVCLIATNAGGSDTLCKTVNIANIPPTADFSFDASNDPEVSFTDESGNIPTSWAWNFDDNGATSTLQNPVYTFTRNGLHNVCLTVSKPAGTNSKCKKVTVYNVPPKAEFTIDTLMDPLFKFTDKSTNSPISWEWNFGDGATSTSQNPSHTYAENGSYEVMLKVNNSGGSDSVSYFVYAKKRLPIAEFSIDSTSDPLITFSDLSKNTPTSWLWDFDEDGATSNLQNPNHDFIYNGIHKVCLTATNMNGSHEVCKTLLIDKAVPIAVFDFDSSGMPIVVFNDQSINSPTSWQWDFDEAGANSSSQNPVYHFTVEGIHQVCLTATNSSGSGTPHCQTVLITHTSIAEKNSEKLLIYPNPAKDKIYVVLDKTIMDNTQIKCYDMLGQQIQLRYQFMQSIIVIDVNELVSGSYFIEVSEENKRISYGKFVVIK